MLRARATLLLLPAALLFGVAGARAHAVLDRAEPRVGSTVRTAPADVKLWFTEWRARVRLDDEVFAPASGAASTESGSSAGRYVRLILEALGVTDEAVAEAMAEWRRAYNAPAGLFTVADPSAEPALELARARGLTAGVISNSNGTSPPAPPALGLLPSLDFVLHSAEVGVEKPDPRIFRLALERARVAPREAVYVGDLYSVDVRGARAAGLDAVLLDPAGLWGARDCRGAPDVLAAVRLILDSR